jgi:hypothetical protein
MGRTRSLLSSSKLGGVRSYIGLLLSLVALLCLGVAAQAQSFSISMPAFKPSSVNPGGNTATSLTIDTAGGFTGNVALSCSITPAPPNGNQGCTVSPSTVTPPSGASVTITTAYTGGTWPPASYAVTITGTAGTEVETASRSVAVLSVSPAFNITVGTAVTPASVPAGSSSNGVVNINPLNGYAGMVTLSCATVTPLVVSPPVCSFSPSTVTVNGTLATSTITISTTGPNNRAGTSNRRRGIYALWLPLPLALVGVGAVGARRRARVWMMLGLLSLAGLMLIPACGSTTTTTTTGSTSNTITPNNTYTFTVTGVDQLGVGATSSGTTTSTVTLTVTTATTP